MRTKLVLTVVALAVSAAAFVAPNAVGAPGATTVTIKAQNGDFSGTISSPRPRKCADGRTVNVFKQKGKTQHPATDKKIASDTSSLNGDRYGWSTGNTGAPNGKYYARAVRTPLCKPASSKTVRSIRTP